MFLFQKIEETILDNLQQLHTETIRETRDLINTKTLNQAASRIMKGKNVVLFTRSPNSYLASVFARKLNSIGCLARVASSDETGLIAAALGEEDCAVIISYSGNNPTKEPLDKIKILKKNRVPMIGITSGGENYLRENVDCIFTMVSRERLYTKIANYSTEESLSFILNSLFSCVFARNYRKNKNFKILNSRVFEQERYTQMKEMRDQE